MFWGDAFLLYSNNGNLKIDLNLDVVVNIGDCDY